SVSDATSGFRAYSRDAAMRLSVVSKFTYTHETLIQAGRSGLAVAEVPIRTNPATRQSRLFRSIPEYVRRSLGTILRIYALYEPMALFNAVAALLGIAGLGLGIRYLYFMAIGEGAGHVQSVIVAALLLMLAGQAFVLGVLADLIAANRKLVQDTRARVRQLQSCERDHE
ncbi:MAG: glycosyltransferase family 2 protein, partial [Armatimonadota bacterium]